MSPGASASSVFRGDDLLPIDPKEVASYLLDESAAVSDAVTGLVNSLNYLALCPGNGLVPEEISDRPLTVPQARAVDHMCKMVKHAEEGSNLQ